MGTTTRTSMASGLVDPASLTTVYEGAISTVQSGTIRTVTITFQNGFIYPGNNLIFHMENKTAGGSGSAGWLGITSGPVRSTWSVNTVFKEEWGAD